MCSLFFPIISAAAQSSAIWLRIARSAMRTLRSVRKNASARFSCAARILLGRLNIPIEGFQYPSAALQQRNHTEKDNEIHLQFGFYHIKSTAF